MHLSWRGSDATQSHSEMSTSADGGRALTFRGRKKDEMDG